jgi:hypothetical protein
MPVTPPPPFRAKKHGAAHTRRPRTVRNSRHKQAAVDLAALSTGGGVLTFDGNLDNY